MWNKYSISIAVMCICVLYIIYHYVKIRKKNAILEKVVKDLNSQDELGLLNRGVHENEREDKLKEIKLNKKYSFEEKNIKVLVVEDNYINQVVVTELLSAKAISPIVVKNAEEALEVLKNNIFDLIFMDIQMPNKNGIDLTVEIRESEKSGIFHTPIIAITALIEEKDRCIEIGMDGCILKPIEPEEFYQIIERSINLDREGRIKYARNSFYESVVSQMVGKDSLVGLEVIEHFLKEYKVYINELRDFMNKKNSEGVNKVAHTLKGMMSNFNYGIAYDTLQIIESKAKEGNLDGISHMIDKVERDLKVFRDVLGKILEDVYEKK